MVTKTRHQSSIEEYIKRLVDDIIPLFCQDSLGKLALLDAFIQFCQNPTSMSAGYGIEESYSFIRMNLKLRYDLDMLSIEKILEFMRQHVDKMYEISYDYYLWRKQILDYILKKESAKFISWYKKLFDQLNEDDKDKFLFLLKAVQHEKDAENLKKWYAPFFDKEEKLLADDLIEVMVSFGLGSRLYYRSSSGYERTEFIPSPFIGKLNEEYEKVSPITEEQITKFFEGLTLSNIKLLEKCVKQAFPVLHISEGLVTQTSKLIVESSKSIFAISPFAWNKIKELIKQKKIQFASQWIEKLKDVTNSFVKEKHPLIESKAIFEIEGSFLVEIRYVASPDQKPIKIGILISPYLFPTTPYTTIIDEMRRIGFYSLEIIILLRETLPAILEAFRDIYARKTLILLLDETEEKFYVIEKGTSIPDEAPIIDNFLSSFLPYFEQEFPISKTWPSELKTQLENLRYFAKFPRIVTLRNKIPEVERKFRDVLRKSLEEHLGKDWKDILRQRIANKIERFEKVIQSRLDKSKTKDFLDGATLGDLIDISNQFTQLMKEDKLGKETLNLLLQHRKMLEHPIEKLESDIDEETFNKISISIEYLEKTLLR